MSLLTRIGPNDRPLPKPAFELTAKKLDPKAVTAATKKVGAKAKPKQNNDDPAELNRHEEVDRCRETGDRQAFQKASYAGRRAAKGRTQENFEPEFLYSCQVCGSHRRPKAEPCDCKESDEFGAERLNFSKRIVSQRMQKESLPGTNNGN